MKCPYCKAEAVEAASITENRIVTRRWWCPECKERFDTTEKEVVNFRREILNLSRKQYVIDDEIKHD